GEGGEGGGGVEQAVDLHRRDRRAFNRREQHAPQRIADRRAETALERLRVEPAEPVRQRFTLELEALGSLKTFPEHRVSFRPPRRSFGATSPTGPQTGLQTCV